MPTVPKLRVRRPWLGALLVFFLAGSAVIQYQAHALRKDIFPVGVTHPMEGKVAPQFTLLDEEGQQVRLSDFYGQVVILDFWASWCGPCRESFPLIEKLQEAKPELVVLAVNLQESPAKAREFMDEEGLDFKVLFDSDGEVADSYGVRSIPTQVLIDKGGAVKSVQVGFSPLTFIGFRAKVEQATK